MDESRVREALQTHVTIGEPPLGLTSAGMVAAGRRSRRLRNAMAGTAACALVLAIAVSLTGLVNRPEGDPVGSGWELPRLGRGPACASPPPDPHVDPTLELPPETVEWVVSAFGCHLQQAVPPMVPAAELQGAAMDDPLVAFTTPGQPAGPAADGQPGPSQTPPADRDPIPLLVFADAVVVDQAGVGSVSFSLGIDIYNDADSRESECASDENRCTITTGPSGELVLVWQIGPEPDADPETAGRLLHNVYVYNGLTAVNAQASNTDPRPAEPGEVIDHAGVARDEPPLSMEQLIEIATAPQLRIFP